LVIQFNQLVDIGDVYNERIEAWALLGFKNLSHSNGIQSICSQTIYSFGWESHQTTFTQAVSSQMQRSLSNDIHKK
jgi:DNA primase